MARGGKARLWAGGTLAAAFLAAAILGPTLAPADPEAISLAEALAPPGPGHRLGCDRLGRDVLSRLLVGARPSLIVGLAAVGAAGSVGTLLGAWAAFEGGAADLLLLRLIDVLQAFPGILLAVALAAVLGPGLGNIVFALAALGWVGYARLARGQVLSMRERDDVTAARAMGAGGGRILFLHLLPGVLPLVAVQAAFGVAGAILAETSLSFLGLGVGSGASWGSMIAEGIEYLEPAPRLCLAPGAAIMAVVLGLNLLGETFSRRP